MFSPTHLSHTNMKVRLINANTAWISSCYVHAGHHVDAFQFPVVLILSFFLFLIAFWLNVFSLAHIERHRHEEYSLQSPNEIKHTRILENLMVDEFYACVWAPWYQTTPPHQNFSKNMKSWSISLFTWCTVMCAHT